MRATNGFVAYEGNSLLGDARVALVVTGTLRPSTNLGTGTMLQGWIILADQHPMEAVRSGADRAICGDCAFRAQGPNGSQRACYVTLMAPGGVYKQYKEGNYGALTDTASANAKLNKSRFPLRVGAYGDPACMTYDFWDRLLKGVSFTGYTSQWQTCDQRLSQFFMASVRSTDEYYQATSMGWRTYRARLPEQELLEGEFVCPKTSEGGETAQCISCLICDGNQSKSKNPVSIIHGTVGAVSAARTALSSLNVLQEVAA